MLLQLVSMCNLWYNAVNDVVCMSNVQLLVELWEDLVSLTTRVLIVTLSVPVRCVHVSQSTSSRTRLAVRSLH